MKQAIFLLFALPILGKAQMTLDDHSAGQHETGIKWVQHMNWQEIKVLAKTQNKFIFVDCNATWCKPCKIMDQQVFTNDTVANLINSNFIAVKVQVDTGKNDDATTRNLYGIAREFEKQYKITGVPSFLFFSPDGEIVHKDAGGKKVDAFINLAQDAMEPSMQLYTLIKHGREGKLDNNLLPAFIKILRDLGDKDIATELARLYMSNHLEQLPEILYTSKANLRFMFEYQRMLTYKDRIYGLCREKPSLLDSLSGKISYAEKLIKNVIIYEDVLPPIEAAKKNNSEPDWHAIRKTVAQQVDFNKTADIMWDAQLHWYSTKKNWPKYSEYYFMRANQTDFNKIVSKDELIFLLNTFAWDLFQYSWDKKHLEKALLWVDEAIKLKEVNDPSLLDTKANILYKLGRKKQAIIIQEKAVSLMNNSNTEIHATLNKMKKGVPTWEKH